jgi:hypothetical protein
MAAITRETVNMTGKLPQMVRVAAPALQCHARAATEVEG